jgi:hypothetical protein
LEDFGAGGVEAWVCGAGAAGLHGRLREGRRRDECDRAYDDEQEQAESRDEFCFCELRHALPQG